MWPVRRMGSIPAVSLRVHVVHLAWASTSPVPPSRTVHAVLPHTALPQAVDHPHSAMPTALAGDPSVALSS